MSTPKDILLPSEDLMEEHAATRRLLRIYDKLSSKPSANLSDITTLVNLFKEYVDQYHNKAEEQFVFKYFLDANKETDLIEDLLKEHQKSIRLTSKLLQLLEDKAEYSKIADTLKQVVQLYAPHTNSEEYKLFPNLRILVGDEKYNKIAELMDKYEQKFISTKQLMDKASELEDKFGILSLDEDGKDNLNKAISNIKPKQLTSNKFDYSSVRPKNDYQIHVTHNPDNSLLVHALDPKGNKVGYAFGKLNNGTLSPSDVKVPQTHRNQGIGTSLYEAMFAHAKNKGAHTVAGDYHSTGASNLHSAMSRKHGMDYKPEGDFGANAQSYENKQQWEQAPSNDYDQKFKPYSYALKSENMYKYEDVLKNWLDLVKVDLELPELNTPLPLSKSSNLHDNYAVEAMVGNDQNLNNALEAAKFLAGGTVASDDKVRQALLEADGDVSEAALAAYGLEVNQANLKALKAIQDISAVHKAEDSPLKATKVDPGHDDARDVAEQIKRAFDDEFVLPVALGGKHTAGSLIAKDEATGNVWLLKPNSGGINPSAGLREDPSTPAAREACFYAMSVKWGLSEYIPESHTIVIDSKEYAAIKLLPWSFRTAKSIKTTDLNRVLQVLDKYRVLGVLHQWAALEYILGSVDSHAGNMLIKGDEVKLIDHGSTFAGYKFNPADVHGFVPYYLRAWSTGKFGRLTPEEKLKRMPRISKGPEEELRRWIEGLKEIDLDVVLGSYGIDPGPCKERLGKVKIAISQNKCDEAIDMLWANVPSL